MGKSTKNDIKKETKEELKEKTISQNKNSKKNLIIIILSIVVVILAFIVGLFIYRNSMENKTTGSDWSDKYYDFLREQSKKKDVNDVLSEESELSFVKGEKEKYPYMIVKKEFDDSGKTSEMVSMFAIDDGKVKYINGFGANKVEVKLYYNVDRKEYNYYLHTVSDTYEDYRSLDSIKYDYNNYNVYKTLEEKGIKDVDSEEAKKIKNEFRDKRSNDNNIDEFTINDTDKKVEQKTLDGKTLEYNKVDEKIVDTGVGPKYFDYKKDMDTVDLRKEVVKVQKDYKDIDKLLNKAIEKVVKEQIDMIEKVKQDIENAKNEIKADEEKKAKEAEERAGFKVGSYRIKYGRYEWDLGELGDYGRKEVYILNSDQTCTYTDYDGKTFSCTFRVGRATDGQSIESAVERDALIIKGSDGYERSYFPKSDGFRDTDLENFIYKGSN